MSWDQFSSEVSAPKLGSPVYVDISTSDIESAVSLGLTAISKYLNSQSSEPCVSLSNHRHHHHQTSPSAPVKSLPSQVSVIVAQVRRTPKSAIMVPLPHASIIDQIRAHFAAKDNANTDNSPAAGISSMVKKPEKRSLDQAAVSSSIHLNPWQDSRSSSSNKEKSGHHPTIVFAKVTTSNNMTVNTAPILNMDQSSQLNNTRVDNNCSITSKSSTKTATTTTTTATTSSKIEKNRTATTSKYMHATPGNGLSASGGTESGRWWLITAPLRFLTARAAQVSAWIRGKVLRQAVGWAMEGACNMILHAVIYLVFLSAGWYALRYALVGYLLPGPLSYLAESFLPSLFGRPLGLVFRVFSWLVSAAVSFVGLLFGQLPTVAASLPVTSSMSASQATTAARPTTVSSSFRVGSFRNNIENPKALFRLSQRVALHNLLGCRECVETIIAELNSQGHDWAGGKKGSEEFVSEMFKAVNITGMTAADRDFFDLLAPAIRQQDQMIESAIRSLTAYPPVSSADLALPGNTRRFWLTLKTYAWSPSPMAECTNLFRACNCRDPPAVLFEPFSSARERLCESIDYIADLAFTRQQAKTQMDTFDHHRKQTHNDVVDRKTVVTQASSLVELRRANLARKLRESSSKRWQLTDEEMQRTILELARSRNELLRSERVSTMLVSVMQSAKKVSESTVEHLAVEMALFMSASLTLDAMVGQLDKYVAKNLEGERVVKLLQTSDSLLEGVLQELQRVGREYFLCWPMKEDEEADIA